MKKINDGKGSRIMNGYELKLHWVAGYYANFDRQNDFIVTTLQSAIMTNKKATIEQTEGIQIFGVYETQNEAQAAVGKTRELMMGKVVEL